MRSWAATVTVLLAVLTVVFGLEAALAAWWDLDDDSLLPLIAAGACMLAAVAVARRRLTRERLRRPFAGGERWADERPLAAAAVAAAGVLVFALAWTLPVAGWRDGVVRSAAAAGALFVVLGAWLRAETMIRRREASKRRIDPADYRPGRLARGAGRVLVAVAVVFVLLALAVELRELAG